MKKKYLLSALLVAVLLLCACSQENNEQPAVEFNPPSRTPSLRPSSSPALLVPEYTAPTTAPRVPVIKPTQPATTPTQPTQPTWTPPPTKPNLDWVTNREIVPFEERFAEDVLFGCNQTSWLMPDDYFTDNTYLEYYLMMNPTYFSHPYIMMEQGIEESQRVYQVPIYLDRLSGMTKLSADGHWAYFSNGYELCRLELLTGELTTLATRNEGDLRWEVTACGKDTVCIFQLDADRNLRVYYRDLHSKAEKTLYEGTLPDVPTDLDNLKFYAPTTTQGQAYWETMNPAFYEVYLKELSNPNSPLKNSADFYKAVQDHYSIPMLVRYSCDFATSTLTEDLGLYDTCWNTTSCRHDHFDYENTREEIPTILNAAPTEIPNFSKLTGDHPFWNYDHVYTCLFSDFGYSHAYWRGESYVHKITDFPVTEMDMSDEYIYAITLDGRVLQFDPYNTICNTVYSSENELRNLYSRGGYVYFTDGNTVVCIDEAAGTWQPILQVSSEVYGFYWQHSYKTAVIVYIRQGMHSQKYQYDLATGTLQTVSTT